MIPLLMTLFSATADAGFGDSGSSATFANLSPTQHVVLLDSQPLPYIPQFGGFVGVGLAPGAHVFQLLTVTGQVVLQSSYTVSPDTHEECTMLKQGASFVPSCSRAAHPPYTAAHLARLGTTMSTSGFGTAAPPPPPQAPPAPAPMSEPQLQQLMTVIKDASFSENQVAVIRTAAARSHFTCAQAARLLGLLSFSDAQLQAVTALKPAILDPENAFQLEAAFSFSSDKEKVSELFR